MAVTVDVSNGIPMSNGSQTSLTAGEHFTWVNDTANDVTLSNCGGFCTASSYGPITKNGGTAVAQVNQNPTNWSFTENPTSTWNPGGPTPGLPHIQNPSKLAEKREVA
jgi:hypothetical protein